MNKRIGEKIGWIGGWIGSFLWVAIMAIVFLVQEKPLESFMGFILVIAATWMMLFCAPWKRPDTRYWKLMTPLFVTAAVAILWALFSFGIERIKSEGLSWWHLALLIPFLSPLVTIGNRRWNDSPKEADTNSTGSSETNP